LAAIGAVCASIGWGGGQLVDSLGRPLPEVPTSASSVLAMFAAILLALALSTRARLRAWRERRPGARPVDPLSIARYGVLARASSPVGAGVVGLYGGYAIFLLPGRNQSGHRDLMGGSVGAMVAGTAVAAAALFLEWVCRLPDDGVPDPRNLPQPRDHAR
jgi:drug/metabolite transporter (DMT)-like permease